MKNYIQSPESRFIISRSFLEIIFQDSVASHTRAHNFQPRSRGAGVISLDKLTRPRMFACFLSFSRFGNNLPGFPGHVPVYTLTLEYKISLNSFL